MNMHTYKQSQRWKRLLGKKDGGVIINFTDGKTEALKGKEIDPEYWMSGKSRTKAVSDMNMSDMKKQDWSCFPVALALTLEHSSGTY